MTGSSTRGMFYDEELMRGQYLGHLDHRCTNIEAEVVGYFCGLAPIEGLLPDCAVALYFSATGGTALSGVHDEDDRQLWGEQIFYHIASAR